MENNSTGGNTLDPDAYEAPIREDESMSGESVHSYSNNNGEPTARASKRARESDSTNEWTTVTGKRRARKNTEKNTEEENTIEVSIYSKDLVPKQFQMARLLKNENITDILRIRYVNSYKVRIQFSNIESAEKLISCTNFIEKGWRMQKTYEVGISYGIIKNVEIELSDEEIKENISSEHELISVKRLMRRNNDEAGWLPSETVRLGFNGTSLPSFIYICDMRVKVESYIYSVTQCSKCWRFGHSKPKCPNKKIVCPKCTGNHENCETTNLKCVNCSGPHWSLHKSCPIYKKERNIRELMSQFNVTYKKASTMYVPPSPLNPRDFPKYANRENISSSESMESLPRRSYAEAAKEPQATSSHQTETGKKKQNKSKNTKERQFEEDNCGTGSFYTEDQPTQNDEQTKKKTTFPELIERIAEIVFMKSYSVMKKIFAVLEITFEWVVPYIEDKYPSFALIKQWISKIMGSNLKYNDK